MAPIALLPPAIPFTLQFTATAVPPEPVAVNACFPPSGTVAELGDVLMAGGGGGAVLGVGATPFTAGASLAISAVSVGAVAGGAMVAAQGIANTTAGMLLMKNANMNSGGEKGPGKWVNVAAV